MLKRILDRLRPGKYGLRRDQKIFIAIPVILVIAHVIFEAYYPIGQSLYMSLNDWHLLGGRQAFVGLANYQEHLTDPLIWQIIKNTVIYAFATTIGTTILGLTVAVIMQPLKRGTSDLFRLIYYLPAMSHAVANATMWLWLLQPRFGLLNTALRSVGLQGRQWLNEIPLAMMTLIVMSYWGGMGGSAVIFYAGLKGIPEDFYEAAAIDGASGLQKVWFITLPLMAPVILFSTVTGLMGGFSSFMSVYLTTGGGPLNSTRVLGLEIYALAFNRLWIGKATALAFILFIIVFTLTLIQLRTRRFSYEM
jgi:multiple sugar transport system permease protein